MLAMLSTGPTETLSQILGDRRDGAWNYIHGLGHGLTDTGVSLLDSLSELAKLGWYVIENYNVISMAWRFVNDEPLVLQEDQERLTAAWGAVQTIGAVLWQFHQAQADIVIAVLTGDEEEINALGEQYRLVLEIGAEILEAAAEAIAELDYDDYETGRLTGRVFGEIVAEVGLAIGTAGVATVAKKSATMANILQRIGAAPSSVIPPPVQAKVVLLAGYVEEMATTRQCFVAGTLVHTAAGLKPIEQIAFGDMVLSRDPATGEQGYKPVLDTFVTHPDALHHLSYSIHAPSGDTTGLITGTGEHPFHSPAANDFVPLAELNAGSALSTSDPAATAYVTDVQVERGPPSRPARFTTYNFEVADWRTYFVSSPEHADAQGAVGLWVHNTSRAACERAFSIITRIKRDRPALSHWEVFVEALNRTNTPARRQAFDPVMPQTVEALMEAMYKEAVLPDGTADLTKVKTWREIFEFRAHHPLKHRIRKEFDLQNHHTAPQHWANIMLRRVPQHSSITTEQMKELLDGMPGLLLNKHYHINHGQGVASFHHFLDARLPLGTTPNTMTILQQIELAYTDWDPVLGPKVWAVAEEWLKSKGVP